MISKESDWIQPSVKIGLDPRKDESLNKTALKNPGPNYYKTKYEATQTSTPRWSLYHNDRFNKKPKSANVQRQNFPGPGKYEYKTKIGEGPSYSFGKDKYNHSDASDEAMKKKTLKYPSPTTYYEDKTKYNPTGPFYSISRLNRMEPGSDKFLLSCPGPVKYNPSKKYLSTWITFPSWGTGKGNRDEDKKVPGSKKEKIITPGPGDYNIKCNIPEGPKYTMAAKLKKPKKEERPGPADYNVDINFQTEPKYSIGKAKKCDELKQIEKDNFPGPKYLVTDVYLTRQITFPKEKKDKKNKWEVPGPGKYRIPTSFDYISNMTRDRGSFDPFFRYV